MKNFKSKTYKVGGVVTSTELFTPSKELAYGRTNGTAKFFQLVYEAGDKVMPPRSLMDAKLLRLVNKFKTR